MNQRSIFLATAFLACCCQGNAEEIKSPEEIERFIASRPQADIITWADEARGGPFTVRFITADSNGIIVEKTLNNKLARRTLPLGEISSISFRFTPTETSVHESPEAAHIPLLQALWKSRKATLRLEKNSETTLTGLSFAIALHAAPTPENLELASNTLTEVLALELSPHLRSRASGEMLINEFLTALESENIQTAEEVAWKITSESEYPDAMLLATGFLGERHFEQLRALEDEHPRWILDDEVRPLRNRLYHLSLDFALYPSLFHPNRKMESSEGLKAAAEVYRFTKSKDLRLATLEDLAALYPESPATKETADELEKLRTNQPEPELAENDPENEDEDPADKSQPTTIPPKPKRYNLFTD